jgi:hypothetical protein
MWIAEMFFAAAGLLLLIWKPGLRPQNQAKARFNNLVPRRS